METRFAENLKSLRTERKLSQAALAKAIGVTQQCVSEWEQKRTEPTLSYLWLLADLFSVSIDILCGREDW